MTIYGITAAFLLQYTRETYLLRKISNANLENSVEDRQPFLEIVFPSGDSKFRNTVTLTNFGKSPAYSPTIESITIGEDTFDFDPLKTSQLPIYPNESREVWVYHIRDAGGGVTASIGDVVYFLERRIADYYKEVPTSPLRIKICCFDKSGAKCERNLFIKVGDNSQNLQKRYIYTSTSLE